MEKRPPQLKSLQSTIRWDHRSETCLPTENTLSLLQSDKQCSTLLDVCCGFYTLLVICSEKKVKWEKAHQSESDNGGKKVFLTLGKNVRVTNCLYSKKGIPWLRFSSLVRSVMSVCSSAKPGRTKKKQKHPERLESWDCF